MNNLGFIEKLLNGVGVEWAALGDILNRTRGTKITAAQMKELHKEQAPIKVFAGGKTFALVSFDDIPSKDIHQAPSIIVKSRGVIEFEYYDQPFSHKNEMWSYNALDTNINIKFIYFYLKTQEAYFQQIGSRMQMPQIATPDTDKFKVPIPCPDNSKKSLEIQAEIVRILDAFTAMTAELTAELNLRQQQYNYYRNQLLSFEEDEVEWKALEEVVKIQRGKRLVKSQLTEYGDYPVYQNSMTPLGYYHEANVQADTAFVIAAGAAGEIGYGSKEIWAADDVYYMENPSNLLSKYLYHFLLTQQYKIKAKVRRASIPRLPRIAIEKIEVPIPSLEEQARIVAILDKFDTLTNSITEGLPREIELRQKQYEYYRDLLFSFPKPEAG